MSTVKVVNVQHPSAATPAVTLASDGSMSGAFPAPNRNLLYNGAMQVAQRGTSTAGIAAQGGYFTADRWATEISSAGTWTMSVENDAPTGSGFRKSVKYLCTTANGSLSAGSYLAAAQYLEGQDLQRIAKGTASAQQLTLSFWVKSNVTGTYVAQLLDVDTPGLRQVSASYTINASATWERKTIAFSADTIGAFDNDNAESLRVYFALAAGSSYTSGTLQTTWAAYNAANRFVGQTNLAAATNNYWQITGVQLEVGPTATGFEFKSYGQELRECQRYYYRKVAGMAYGHFSAGWSYAATNANTFMNLPVTMRTTPTSVESGGTLQVQQFSNSTYAISVVTIGSTESNPNTVLINVTHGAGTANTGTFVRANNDTTAYIAVSAEL
jgi:hypothetical protein